MKFLGGAPMSMHNDWLLWDLKTRVFFCLWTAWLVTKHAAPGVATAIFAFVFLQSQGLGFWVAALFTLVTFIATNHIVGIFWERFGKG